MEKYSTVVGIDLGDRQSLYKALAMSTGEDVQSGSIQTTKAGLTRAFGGWEPSLFVIEACGQSRWVSEHLGAMGHEVLVGNTRKLRCIYDTDDKSDARDADMLARLGRLDPKLLYPIQHRSKEAQEHLAVLKSRDAVVAARTKLINHVRSVVKGAGERLPTSSADYFYRKVADQIPAGLMPAVAPLLECIGQLTESIRDYDKKIDALCRHYPATEVLQSIAGVGPLTSLGYILTLEFPERFKDSRQAAAFAGLTPRRDQSGETDKQLRITKAGSGFLRKLLVSAAQYILGPFGRDSELRRWGLRLAERGGKNGKKRAVVAVARKLAVLLHRMWANGMLYDPFPKGTPEDAAEPERAQVAASDSSPPCPA